MLPSKSLEERGSGFETEKLCPGTAKESVLKPNWRRLSIQTQNWPMTGEEKRKEKNFQLGLASKGWKPQKKTKRTATHGGQRSR